MHPGGSGKGNSSGVVTKAVLDLSESVCVSQSDCPSVCLPLCLRPLSMLVCVGLCCVCLGVSWCVVSESEPVCLSFCLSYFLSAGLFCSVCLDSLCFLSVCLSVGPSVGQLSVSVFVFLNWSESVCAFVCLFLSVSIQL